jgi:hypothetical protein
MKSEPSNPSVGIEKDLSWTLFLAICAGFLLPLWLVGYCVVYTEGEVMHGLFRGLTVLAGMLVLLGFRRRKLAAAWVVAVCGGLLIWQTWQIRKWAMLHEEMLELVWYLEETKRDKGAYPESIDGYGFRRAWVKNRVINYRMEGAKFGFTYFMHYPGTSYWYDSENSFGYYPD